MFLLVWLTHFLSLSCTRASKNCLEMVTGFWPPFLLCWLRGIQIFQESENTNKQTNKQRERNMVSFNPSQHFKKEKFLGNLLFILQDPIQIAPSLYTRPLHFPAPVRPKLESPHPRFPPHQKPLEYRHWPFILNPQAFPRVWHSVFAQLRFESMDVAFCLLHSTFSLWGFCWLDFQKPLSYPPDTLGSWGCRAPPESAPGVPVVCPCRQRPRTRGWHWFLSLWFRPRLIFSGRGFALNEVRAAQLQPDRIMCKDDYPSGDSFSLFKYI